MGDGKPFFQAGTRRQSKRTAISAFESSDLHVTTPNHTGGGCAFWPQAPGERTGHNPQWLLGVPRRKIVPQQPPGGNATGTKPLHLSPQGANHGEAKYK